jgi:uncharacterized membrane protein YidH (DUF202 family)
MSEDRAARPFDPGLQPERTALAWRRTALAITVGALVAVRILPEKLGLWAILPAGAGLVLATCILVAAHHRYQAHHSRLTTADSDRIALPDGSLPALVAVTVAVGGTLCLLTVLKGALS